MAMYVLMTKLAPECIGGVENRRTRGKDWMEKVNKACPEVNWIAHYALLGRYDFMDIYEAKDDAVAHKVSLISRNEGALAAESWPAIEYDEHLALLQEIGH